MDAVIDLPLRHIASPAIATVPRATGGHRTSITLIPVSSSLSALLFRGRGSASKRTTRLRVSRLRGASVWRSYPPAFRVSDGKLGQRVRQRVWIKWRVNHIAPRGDETSDPVDEVIGRPFARTVSPIMVGILSLNWERAPRADHRSGRSCVQLVNPANIAAYVVARIVLAQLSTGNSNECELLHT